MILRHNILQQPAAVNSLTVNFQKMLPTCKSYKDFKKIIAVSAITPKPETQNQFLSKGELSIQSRVEETPYLLGLESEKSKLTDKAVKSSIDSDKKKKSNNNSIPLSELILRDNGYDYLFLPDPSPKKIQQKFHLNLKQLKRQTQELIALIQLQLIAIQKQYIQQQIDKLHKQISNLRTQRKNKSPIQQYSDYLGYVGNKRKQRCSGKFIADKLRESRSNLKTQCDSKGPSLTSAPTTPTPRCKMMLSPHKQFLKQYFLILKSKKQTIKSSIDTLTIFYTRRIEQNQRQNNAYHKQIILLDSKNINTPVRRQKLRCTVGTLEGLANSNRSHRRLFGFHSPRDPRRPRKSQMVQLLSHPRRQFASNPREEYFISN